MSFRQYFVGGITALLPPTRAYSTKARLWRMAGFDIDPTARIVSSVTFSTSGPVIIGANSYIGEQVFIGSGNAPISIGCNVDIAPRVALIGGTHELDMVGARTAGCGLSKPIDIEDGVWIGACSTILGGVRIGKKSMIAAGSVVTRNIPAYCLAAGVPARVVKCWDLTAGACVPETAHFIDAQSSI